MADVTWEGIDKFAKVLRDAPGDVLFEVARAMKREGERIMTQSKRWVPVDLGTLKGSGFVESPKIGRRNVTVTMGYGGDAKAYALYQHERTDLNHPGQGRAKYLEAPVKGHAKRFTAAIDAAIVKAMR